MSVTLPVRAAFYYPWYVGGPDPVYPGAWNQAFKPFTQYQPVRGYYDSSNAAIVSAHVSDLIYAKFKAGIVSWWGQGSREDLRIPSLLSAAVGKDFYWAVYYEAEGNTIAGVTGSPDPTSAQITSDLNYITANYTSHPNYLHISGKPVIFVYGGAEDGGQAAGSLPSARWFAANAGAAEDWYYVLKVYGGYTGDAHQPPDWHQYGPAAATDQQGAHSFTVSPGYWAAPDTSPLLARDVASFSTNVQAMLAASVNWKLVTTYNEWVEGTSIEAANGASGRNYVGPGWQTGTARGIYLDILANDGVIPTIPAAGTNLLSKQYMAHIYAPPSGGAPAVAEVPSTLVGPFTLKLQPNGVGASSIWTPTSGANWTNVIGAPGSGAAAVSTSTPGNIDLYAQPGGIPAGATIVSVTLNIDGIGNTTSDPLVQAVLQIAGVNYFSPNLGPLQHSGYITFPYAWTLSPATGVAFTPAEVNALQIGLEFISGTSAAVVDSVWIDVVYMTGDAGSGSTPSAQPDTGAFIRAWPDMADLPSFNWQINGGPESLKMTLPRAWGESGEVGEAGSLADLQMENQVDIYVIDEDTSGDGNLLYRGYIEEYDQNMPAVGVPVTLVPYTSLFQDTWIDGPLVFTNTDPTDMMQSIIEAYVPGVSWDIRNPQVGLTFSQTIQSMKATAAMEIIRRLGGSQWYWRLNPDNSLTFNYYDLLAPATHKLNANHYTNVKFTRSRQDVKTRVFLFGQKEQRADDGTLTQPKIAVVVTGANFNAARPRDLVITDTRITDNGTATRIANAELEYNRADAISGTIEVIDNNYDADKGYDIESFHPGDTLEFFHPDLTYDWPKYDGNYFYDSDAAYNGVYASLIRGPLVISAVAYKGTSAIVTLTTRPAGVIEALVGIADKQLLSDSAA